MCQPRSLAFVVVGWLAAVACSPGAGTSVPCNSDDECAALETCVLGLCQAGSPTPAVDAGTQSADAADGVPDEDAGSLDADSGSSDDGGAPDDAGDDDAGDDDAGDNDGGSDAGERDAGESDAGPGLVLPEGCSSLLDFVLCTSPLAAAAAQSSCEGLGLTLAEIEGASDNAVLATAAAELGQDLWIGLDDVDVEGVFRWRSGADLAVAFFAQGEPNNFNDNEHCVELTQSGGWNDLSCATPMAYVCGEPNPPFSSPEPYCLSHPAACSCQSIMFGGTLYALCDHASTFSAAAAACDALGMSSVKLESAREADFLGREAELLSRSFWIGLGDEDGDGEHRFRDGTLPSFDVYASEESANECALVTASGVIPSSCESASGFACEVLSPMSVADDCSDPDGSGRYLSCTLERTFDEARATCQRAGMDLIIIDDDEENAMATGLLEALGDLWLGFSDQRQEGILRSVNGALVAFSSFAHNEPNNSFGGEDCGELRALTSLWNDSACDEVNAFVCEAVSTLPELPAAGPLCLRQPALCPCETRVRDDVVFSLCPNAVTWSEANAACSALRMQMLEPGSAEVDAFLRSELDALPLWSGTWLGLNDRNSEGTYLWPSGAAMTFTSWGGGQPNGSGDCVEIAAAQDNRWKDTQCVNERRMACQAPLPVGALCFDLDGDGHGFGCALGDDCDDDDASRNPLALDICNGVDDDCSGAADDDPWGCGCELVSDNGVELWTCDTAVSWYGARGQCRAYGGALALPESAFEDAYLAQLLAGKGMSRTWLGASDLASEGVYANLTGAPLDYTSWANGQPDDSSSENCVERREGGWHDDACTSLLASVCAMP